MPRPAYTPEQRQVLDRGLRMLARMIAQAYLRDVGSVESSSTANPTSMTGAGDHTQQDPVDDTNAAATPDPAS